MEVVSTSNLVSSETEKVITACNFQHDYAMRGQIGSYAYIQIWSYSWKLFHDSRNVKKHPKKHIYTKQQNQNQPEEICFILNIHYSSEQKKVDK